MYHLTLPEVITHSSVSVEKKNAEYLKLKENKKGVLNLASQIYNYDFFWKCLTPEPKHRDRIPNDLVTSLTTYFGSVEQFKQAFATVATNHFGSGWLVYVRLVWLTWNKKEGKLQLFEGHDAENPLQHELVPLLTIDVWEHAYYLDYKNERAKFIDKFWNFVNWSFVASNLRSTTKGPQKEL
ncbi:iron superoxide dismutase [Reticulomyxa filosa]|uniref:superoxide dismutase n=1 Tax=Reticulomyxa filosa TaxID=46433 RepID=X6LVZ4_RETFI|nr:iron superoxide dismutase [Reticulomyxa filosa]|eukprot:ETO06118.1 iron superoxide dismutase [Reticulomyxa filosa]